MPPTQHAEIPPLREAFQQFMRLLRLIRAYWGALGKGMVLGLVLGLFGMITPYLSKLLIDEVYPTRNLTLMQVLVVGILVVAVASSVMSAIRSYFTSYTTCHLANATSLLFFNHLQHLRTRFFDEHRVGEIISRFADVRNALNSVARVFETLFVNGGVPAAGAAVPLPAAVEAGHGRADHHPAHGGHHHLSARLLRALLEEERRGLRRAGRLPGGGAQPHPHAQGDGAGAPVYERAQRQIQSALQVQLKAGGSARCSAPLTAVVARAGDGGVHLVRVDADRGGRDDAGRLHRLHRLHGLPVQPAARRSPASSPTSSRAR